MSDGGVITFTDTMVDGFGQTATITSTVTQGTTGHPELYKWNYHVHNNNFDVTRSPVDGIGHVVIQTEQLSQVQMMGNTLGWGNYSDGSWISAIDSTVFWSLPPDISVGLLPGQEGDFFFYTVPLPIITTTAEMWNPDVAGGGTGGAKSPGIPKADIDIADITVGTQKTEFSGAKEPQEDSIGGLVVRRADNNNAPRHKVTVQKLTDQAGNVAVGGKVEFTYSGGVKVFASEAGNDAVASGTKYDQTALPKDLWVQGDAGSSKMRDVKLTATPVGNAVGKDDVAFTVLWVGMDSIASEGSNVSPKNDKIGNYRIVMIDQGTKLGSVYASAAIQGGARWGTEAKGLVYPNDFSYPGSDLRLDRDVQGKSSSPTVGSQVWQFSGTYPNGNDTSLDLWRDDNPLDSDGYIYDLDLPGISANSKTMAPQYEIARIRMNFKAFASIMIESRYYRPSSVVGCYVRFSLVQAGAGMNNVWHFLSPPDVAGDNKSQNHAFTQTTDDLQ